MLTVDEANYGAAYHVLYSRLNPDASTTRADHDAILIALAKVSEWAETQTPQIAAAYAKASNDIRTNSNNRVENTERANQMLAARRLIPVPPL